MYKVRLLFWALPLWLAACNPIYQTNFEMVPPPTEHGRMCANNCLLMQQNCQQSCALQQQQCDQVNRLEAQNRYQQYVIDRQREGKPIKKNVDNFYYGSSCSARDYCEQQCQNSYHICHTNCGGQVIPRTMCVANCDRQVQ